MNHSQLRPTSPATSRVRPYGRRGAGDAAGSRVVATALTRCLLPVPSVIRVARAAGPGARQVRVPGPAGVRQGLASPCSRTAGRPPGTGRYCSSQVKPAVTVLPWRRLSPALVPVVAKVYAIRYATSWVPVATATGRDRRGVRRRQRGQRDAGGDVGQAGGREAGAVRQHVRSHRGGVDRDLDLRTERRRGVGKGAARRT